jgi:endonuclease/exonuclease/phosphatase family metal-dependent hydrolase
MPLRLFLGSPRFAQIATPMKMPLRTFLFHLVALLTLAATSPAQESRPTIRVLTYNIHHGEGTDAKLDLDRIAKVIRSASPDLVALQEVDQKTQRTGGVDQLAKLAELTGMHSAFGKAMDFQGGGYGVAMLAKWPIQDAVTHQLPITPGIEPRAILAGTISIADRGPKIQFSVTHVDHRSDPTQRALQVAKIRELFPPKAHEVPAILAGDFNAVPDSEVVQSLLKDWSDSATGHQFFTSPSNPPRRKIDYIFVRPAAAWRVIETRALEESVASDHRPVLAVLELL